MFNNLLNYYLKHAQNRINQRIEEINNERKALKDSGDTRYKDLKSINNTQLYRHKPKTIKEIRESNTEVLSKKLTITVAESLKANIKLKPDLITTSTIKDEEMDMKKSNLEFVSVQDLLWGFTEEYTEFDKFNFFLNLFLDLRKTNEYYQLVFDIVIDYVPFAKYLATGRAHQKYPFIIPREFKNTNVDLLAEAVYFFCRTYESEEIMQLFTKFLHSTYKYESKDSNGRFQIKTGIISFQNFEEAFTSTLKEILEPLWKRDPSYSLGKRAYDIVMEDMRLESAYNYLSSLGDGYINYTTSGKLETDVWSELMDETESYIEKLIYAQKEFYGDVEKEYFMSELFMKNATEFFSEDRYLELSKTKQRTIL
ncbi:hypothetical protein I4Q36_06945 [Tuanshanicoccus lijuaniae]|uniref:hypothetical protein n=1 Tax=Aerococcaceae bacterium zg-1292 TaxID=2774330 RepID=UPI001935C4BF|nr:hypothetical protein [Aerococcaceae bacterium zg-1292]QQA36547.1 hypothetical protein I4Q36_06945 [Aerococcaceae bacterium zg-1292]